jgi:hypothetical protein
LGLFLGWCYFEAQDFGPGELNGSGWEFKNVAINNQLKGWKGSTASDFSSNHRWRKSIGTNILKYFGSRLEDKQIQDSTKLVLKNNQH